MTETILFESILTDADCHATEPGAHPGWILKFENGAIIRADPAGHKEKTRKEEVWWVGRKYRVKMQQAGMVALNQYLVAELLEEEPK